MITKPNQLLNGDFVPSKQQCKLINRTAGTRTNGDIVALNLDFQAVSGQAMVGLTPGTDDDASTGYVFAAAIVPTTANRNRILAVVDDPRGTVADNDEFLATIFGQCAVNMTHTANKGEFLTGTDASHEATPLTSAELDSQATPVGIVGLCLETTTAATSAGQRKQALFNGWALYNQIGGGG